MEKRKTLVFAIAMIAIMIAFTACSADRGITNRPTLAPGEVRATPIDIMPRIEPKPELETEQNVDPRTLPRKIPICVKRNKTELRPLGIVDDVIYLGYDNGKIMFGSIKAPYYVVELRYLEGQNYFLSSSTVFKNVLLEETTEILYYN